MDGHLHDFEQLSLRYSNGTLEVLDQRRLPAEEVWIPSNSIEVMWDLIKQLSVRGAPLIGVAAAMALAIKAQQGATKEEIIKAADHLITSRPTAVNLMYCCNKIKEGVKDLTNTAEVRSTVVRLAEEIYHKEVEMNDKMAKLGADLISPGEGILTHCNTGTLATPGKGTALGVIREAHAQGKNIHVYVDETRPLLQGGRLTAYELKRSGIPYTLITDNMAATLMRQGKIQRVFVGADRIATNGDFANKIGTYSVAVIAKHHGIPFHAVAPISTVDFDCNSGESIPIEERKKEEVLGASGHFGSVTWAPVDAHTYNPAFDVTPVELVTSIVLDAGVFTQADLKGGKLAQLKASQ